MPTTPGFLANSARRCRPFCSTPRGPSGSPAIAPAQLTLAEFAGELTDLVERQRLVPRGREEGHVRVLTAEQVRNLDIPYLFLAGLNERSFPQHRGDDCLYGEGERRDLNRHGLALGHRAQHVQEELLMFYGIVTRARKQLVLTYPTVSTDGQPLSPSPYVSGLIDLFDPAALKNGLEEQLDPVPRRERILSSADARVHGMSEALAGRPGLFRAVCGKRKHGWRIGAGGPQLPGGDRDERAPVSHAGLHNYEGRLNNPRNIELLRQRFSPEREFSATQLEAYARCPFRFFMSQVLAIEPSAAPDIETDYGRRGTLIHEILAELHQALVRSARIGRRQVRDGTGRGRGGDVSKTAGREVPREGAAFASSRSPGTHRTATSWPSGESPTAGNGMNMSPGCRARAMLRRCRRSSKRSSARRRQGPLRQQARSRRPGIRIRSCLEKGPRSSASADGSTGLISVEWRVPPSFR